MRSRDLIPILALSLGLALPAGSAAETADLVTDRPDQTESSVVVPKGTVQLETGVTRAEEEEGGVEAEVTELASTLVRIGIAERWELRVGWTGFVDAEVTGPGGRSASVDGIGDGELGAKVYLWEESGSRPEAALLFGTSLPVGDDELTSDEFDPSFRLSFAHTLSDRVGLGYNVGMAWAGDGEGGDGSQLSDFVDTVAAGFELTSRWGAFVELFGEIAASSDEDPRHSFDGGVTYLLGERLQLDLAAGVGLSDAADDWFVGAGVSARWPR